MKLILCNTIAFILGCIVDAILGDPHGWPHIIILYGKLISKLESVLYKIENKTFGGALLTIFTVGIVGCVTGLVLFLSYKISIVLYIIVEALITWQLIAVKSLRVETEPVYDALKKGDIKAARYAVSMVVGRDTENLTEEGVTKAAVETIAENTADGIAAPLFYIMLAGALGGSIYKAINTLDSSVGYKNDRYIHFGTVSAKLDDFVNYIPARLCAFVMIFASGLLGYDAKNAYRIWKRDKRNHASPNSAQTESVVAGALDVQLAGNAYYFGKLYEKPYIGDHIRDIEIEDIKRAHKILRLTSVLIISFIVLARILVYAAL